VDPIQAIIAGNWGAVTGWSLWIGTVVVVVTGAFREWWVPGRRARRVEAALEKAIDTTKLLAEQNGQLITANEITKFFFEETTPHRDTSKSRVRNDGGDPA
jgi:hypothetical protein